MSEPCENGGECFELDGGDYICQCPSGLTGRNCQQDIEECASSPCAAGSTCKEEIGGYTCICRNGIEGMYHTQGSVGGMGEALFHDKYGSNPTNLKIIKVMGVVIQILCVLM